LLEKWQIHENKHKRDSYVAKRTDNVNVPSCMQRDSLVLIAFKESKSKIAAEPIATFASIYGRCLLSIVGFRYHLGWPSYSAIFADANATIPTMTGSTKDCKLHMTNMTLQVVMERVHSWRGPRLSKAFGLAFSWQTKSAKRLGCLRDIVTIKRFLIGLQSSDPLPAINVSC
jgi:hypothetical protein